MAGRLCWNGREAARAAVEFHRQVELPRNFALIGAHIAAPLKPKEMDWRHADGDQ
jgi:hypothetical protein